jgi:hypothetical protein
MTSTGASPPAGSPAPRRRRGYWIPAVIAMTALTAIGLALGAGDLDHGNPTVLHGPDVAQQIGLGIQVQQATHAPPEVHCPASEPVRVGYEFVCTTIQAGVNHQIQVVEIDGRGHLRWQLSP